MRAVTAYSRFNESYVTEVGEIRHQKYTISILHKRILVAFAILYLVRADYYISVENVKMIDLLDIPKSIADCAFSMKD